MTILLPMSIPVANNPVNLTSSQSIVTFCDANHTIDNPLTKLIIMGSELILDYLNIEWHVR